MQILVPTPAMLGNVPPHPLWRQRQFLALPTLILLSCCSQFVPLVAGDESLREEGTVAHKAHNGYRPQDLTEFSKRGPKKTRAPTRAPTLAPTRTPTSSLTPTNFADSSTWAPVSPPSQTFTPTFTPTLPPSNLVDSSTLPPVAPHLRSRPTTLPPKKMGPLTLAPVSSQLQTLPPTLPATKYVDSSMKNADENGVWAG